MTKTLNGRDSGLDYISVHQAPTLLEYDPSKHEFSHYLKGLSSFRSELHKLDARERRITDNELLEKVKNTPTRLFGLGNCRTVGNDNFVVVVVE